MQYSHCDDASTTLVIDSRPCKSTALLSRFVRFISHEIRTPLNVVDMGLRLIETELLQYTTDLLQLGYRNSGYDMVPATIEKVLTLLRDFEQHVKTSGTDLSNIASSRDGSVYKQFNGELCSKLLGACSTNEFNQLMSSEYKMIDWMQLIQGAHSNTQDAVEILNDILNYDKV